MNTAYLQHKEQKAIVINEGEQALLALDDRDAALIQRRYNTKLNLSHTEQQGVYKLAAPRHVGRLSLPSGAMLVIKPKVPVKQLFTLLVEAAELADFHPPPTGLESDDEIFLLVLRLFLAQVEGLVAHGLYRTYQEQTEDLPLVRGHILLGRQLQQHGDLKHKHVCGFADFSIDTPENRIVAAALRALPGLLSHADNKELLIRSRALLRYFAEVRVTTTEQALSLLPLVSFHRLNAAYPSILAVARLILHHLTLIEQAGRYPLASFLIDMPRLFERFVAAVLRRGITAKGFKSLAQRADYLDEQRHISIRPDLLIYQAGDSEPVLVLDTKYKQLSDLRTDDMSPDIYQLNAYMDRYRLERGALVYPRFTSDSAAHLQFRGSGKQMHFLTLDLGGASSDDLIQASGRLLDQVTALAKGEA